MKKVVVAALLLASMATCEAIAEGNKVAVSDLKLSQTSGGVYEIDGIGKNVSGKNLANIFVHFNLLKDGVVIGEAISGAKNIEPGQKFTISAPFYSAKFKPNDFKVTEINAH
ncbi:FxLYD domain-containing protein [Pantoea stewartii]|uniref:FxLYD domain-containing protein n=1 Tax=Pantoea stewartii TaxID=66269 RepID=UPI001CF7770E|nr:FxLYD domain-containing protein [Pantoea stewartii]